MSAIAGSLLVWSPSARVLSGPADVLYADPADVMFQSGPVEADLVRMVQGNPPTATIAVTYTGFTPEAQAAFQAAVDIWATVIVSPAPIRIRATYTALGPGVLGSAGPSAICTASKGISGTYYAAALADKIQGAAFCAGLAGATSEINASFSSAFSNWDFGTSGVPVSGKYNFLTVVLHEIGHGLGFYGSMSATGGTGSFRNVPDIYDRFAVTGSGTPLLAFTNPSSALGSQLVSSNTFFNGPKAVQNNGGVVPKLDTHFFTSADNGFQAGSSYSHLDDALYTTTSNGLMTWALAQSEVYTDPGPIVRGVFTDEGWGVSGNSAPTISAIGNQTINEDQSTSTIAFTIGDAETSAGSLTLSGSSSNTALVPAASISFGGSGSNRTISLTPAANQNGTATITVTVSDGTSSTSTTFLLTVIAVNDPPTISAIPAQTTNEDVPVGPIAFTVSDPEGAASLSLSGTCSNGALIPAANIVFGGSGSNRTVTITPAPNQNGLTTIVVTTSDGSLSASTSFTLTVTAVNDAPTITAIGDQTITRNGSTGPLAFSISDVETTPTLLTLAVSSSNLTLVPAANVVLGGSGSSRTVSVTPAANAFGTSIIAVTVSDGALNASTSFALTVLSGSDPRMSIDGPAPDAIVYQPFLTGGWAVDLGPGSGPGTDAVHVWAFPVVDGVVDGAHGIFVAQGVLGGVRDDVGAVFGPRFTNSGFTFTVQGLPAGEYELGVYVRSTVTDTFNQVQFRHITIKTTDPYMSIDGPAPNAIVQQPFLTGGWAVDLAAPAGNGVDDIHVWAFPVVNGVVDAAHGIFVVQGQIGGTRSDVGAVFGHQFDQSGFTFVVSGLPPGVYELGVYARSSVTGLFQGVFRRITVQ